ncbi:MAG: RNA methyltransferase [Clostridia bacterium]|nr:RNA methyltransferase [Clostridia bacterium]
MIITSQDNNTVKSIVKLKDKKYREQSGKYYIEGYRCVKYSLPFAINPTLIIHEDMASIFGNEFSSYPQMICADGVFRKLADTENSQGIVCVADKKVPVKNRDAKYALFLDRVRDPGNLGTILRTALAVGFNDIYLYDCVDAYNPKVVRSAMSAVTRVNTFIVDISEIECLKSNGYTVLCADMDGESVFNRKNTVNEKICLVIGNEANGVLDEVKNASNEAISLPMEQAESLNAGVCSAVMMYALKFNK